MKRTPFNSHPLSRDKTSPQAKRMKAGESPVVWEVSHGQHPSSHTPSLPHLLVGLLSERKLDLGVERVPLGAGGNNVSTKWHFSLSNCRLATRQSQPYLVKSSKHFWPRLSSKSSAFESYWRLLSTRQWERASSSRGKRSTEKPPKILAWMCWR